MTDKELRQLKRADLIEILYYMRQEIDDLRAENQKLNDRLDHLITGAVQQKQTSEDGEQKAHE
ncbi:MAG: hypothetical protein K2H89_00340 [Oscillospiraceae bacterium]|nr:hypothetical protein [Oscillospiraceae bacterium]